MKSLPFLSLILLLFTITRAQEKKPITHEDMWLMKRVNAPAVSPDGKWVIFSVVEPSYEEKEQVNDIWVVASDGSSNARKLTAGKAGESAYAWSPDGKYIAFVAKRDGDEESQIYILNFREGGEAQRLTHLSTGASSPRWNPDGTSLLFTSNVYPLCYSDSCNKKAIDEKKKLKYKARVYTTFPIRDFDTWLDERQEHAFIQSIDSKSEARDIFTDVAISRGEGFSFSGATWSMDGKEIIFSAATDAHSAAYQEPTAHLYKVSASGGDAYQLTTDNSDFSGMQFSADGKFLYCFITPTNNYKVYNLNRLTRFDWPSMQNKTIISEGLDRPINNFAVGADRIYLSVEDEGRDKLYATSMTGSELKLVSTTNSGCLNAVNISKGSEGIVVCNYETASSPPEIARLNPDGSHSMLTHLNDEKLSKLDLGAIETMWFTTKHGKKIRSMVVKPAGFDPTRKYPLFVVMHGGPAGSWKENWGYRWNYHLLAQPGYVLILTDYTGSTGYGEKFGQEIQYDPFKGPADEINQAAAEAIKQYNFIDGTKQACGGASYGGHLANWMQATTTHYKCLISHAGLVNSVSQWGSSDVIYGREVMNGSLPWTSTKIWKDQNPYKYADDFKTPMLITVGEMDFRVPLNNSIENWHILQRQKVPGKLIVFPEENHWILKGEDSRFFYQEVHAWLKEYLK